jgi:phenylalanine-4-hydroxylase
MTHEHRRAKRSQRDAVWRTLCARQEPALERGMCSVFLAGAHAIRLDRARLPRHAELSRRLHDLCGWRIETVPGLIPAADFFALLRERRFPSPDWIRHPDDLEYTPEPDAFHDLFGHVPQLASPEIARVLEELADAARGASDGEIAAIERVYWFTIEFGLVQDACGLRVPDGVRAPDGLRAMDGVRAIGAGLASSIAELERALHAPSIARREFVLREAAAMPFVTDRPQELYLVTRDLDALAAEMRGSGWRTLGRVA